MVDADKIREEIFRPYNNPIGRAFRKYIPYFNSFILLEYKLWISLCVLYYRLLLKLYNVRMFRSMVVYCTTIRLCVYSIVVFMLEQVVKFCKFISSKK